MSAQDESLRDFAVTYTSAARRHAIALDDQNRAFRANVAKFVAANLDLAPTELLEDLVEEEAKYSYGRDINFGAFASLMSELLMRGGEGQVWLLVRVVRRNMDLDGTLSSGGLRLTVGRRNELLAELGDREQGNSQSDSRFSLARGMLERASVRPDSDGLDV